MYCRVAKFYENQKNMMLEAAKEHLAGLADWTEPQAGAQSTFTYTVLYEYMNSSIGAHILHCAVFVFVLQS